MKGIIVKAIVKKKGFGFIEGEDGKEYFLHSSAAKEFAALEIGTAVIFDPIKDDRGMKAVNVVSNFSEALYLPEDIDLSGFTGPDGKPLLPGSQEERHIITDVRVISEEMLKILDKNPELMFELSSRKFEEVIAELLFRQGYQIELTPESKDGGFDIYAAKKEPLGSFLFLVECKRFAPNRPVGVELIRELHGVVDINKATAGIAVTTSRFTKGALEFQRKLEHRIALQDFFAIKRWIQKAIDPPRS
ncbi:MAG: restriction endonuclease [Rhodospirillales bacterium]|nr:restriction endonuclease [Rhodospirillales bacterium]